MAMDKKRVKVKGSVNLYGNKTSKEKSITYYFHEYFFLQKIRLQYFSKIHLVCKSLLLFLMWSVVLFSRYTHESVIIYIRFAKLSTTKVSALFSVISIRFSR